MLEQEERELRDILCNADDDAITDVADHTAQSGFSINRIHGLVGIWNSHWNWMYIAWPVDSILQSPRATLQTRWIIPCRMLMELLAPAQM